MKKTRENKKNNESLKSINSQRAITLIALVVTIVVLLILAGVSLSLVLGENGLINKAKEGRDKYAEATKNEQSELDKVDEWLEENTGSIYKPMITKWNIEAGNEVKIYLYSPWSYNGHPLEDNTNVTIDWGDGTKESYTSSNLQYDNSRGYVTHTYQDSNSGTIIEISGECNMLGMSNNPQLISVEDWGYTGSSYYDFGYCDNLTTISSPRTNTFKDVMEFAYTFSGCRNLTEIPANLFENCKQVTDFEATFSHCRSLTSIPANLFENCEQVETFSDTFSGCTNLISIPANLFANCEQVTNFGSTFADCTSLTSIPANLFENCEQVERFKYTFYNCTNLIGEAIKLWERVENGAENGYEGIPDGYGCYYGCTKLTNYDVIPEYWKEEQEVT